MTLSKQMLAHGNDEDRNILGRWIRAQNTPQSIVQRARIVMMTLAGESSREIGKVLKVSQPTIRLWQKRFLDEGPQGLCAIAAGRGRPAIYTSRKAAKIVRDTQHSTPLAQTHWSTRSMAKIQGVSKDTVHRIWRLHGLKPHQTRTFKISKDKQFVEKLTDIVGVYLNPPDRAVVLCVDEKSQIQALDRTQPGLPMKKGRCGTQTHDYVRNGTTTLFAALNVLDGKVVGECLPRHRHQEFLKFLRTLDDEFPDDVDLHLILDNYGTHKHPKVKKWLANHPRFKLHFTPTSASWTNLVERWFRELTEKAIRRGTFISVEDLQIAIENFMVTYNEDAKPFIWTASVQTIMAKLQKVKAIYETLH